MFSISTYVSATDVNKIIKGRIYNVQHALDNPDVEVEIAEYLKEQYNRYVPYSKYKNKVHLADTAKVFAPKKNDDGATIHYYAHPRHHHRFYDYAEDAYTRNIHGGDYFRGVHKDATEYWDEVAWAENGDVYLRYINKIVRKAMKKEKI